MRNRNNNLPEATVVGTGLQTTDAQTVHFADAQIEDWHKAYGVVFTEENYTQMADSCIKNNFNHERDPHFWRQLYRERGRDGLIRFLKEEIETREAIEEDYRKSEQRWKDLSRRDFNQFVLEASTEFLSFEEQVKGHREKLDEQRRHIDQGRDLFNRLNVETDAFVKRYNKAITSSHFDIMALSNEFAALLKKEFVPLKKFMKEKKEEKEALSSRESRLDDLLETQLARKFIEGAQLLCVYDNFIGEKEFKNRSDELYSEKYEELGATSKRMNKLVEDRMACRVDWAELGEKWEEMKDKIDQLGVDITAQEDNNHYFALHYSLFSIQKPALSIQQQLSSVKDKIPAKNQKNVSSVPTSMFNGKNKSSNMETALSDTSSSNNSNDSSQNQDKNKKKSSCTIS